MKSSYRTPINDPHSSYTHSCNNLASYEMRKNPNTDKGKLKFKGVDHMASKMSMTMSDASKGGFTLGT